MKRSHFFVTIFFTCLSFSSFGDSAQWQAYIAGLRSEAIAQGIRPAVFDEAFANIHEPNRRVLHYDHAQPEKRLTYPQYQHSRVDAYRIRLGQQEYKKNAALLNDIAHTYGVNPCIIISLWGMESSYGRFTGKFPVIQALATLAYDNRRAATFRKELFYALQILNGNHVALKNFKGEWAGASGQPQFLPSSWHAYAVDYNGDGRKDIWETKADVFASIANYLSKNGWQPNTPFSVLVTLPSDFNTTLMSRKIKKPVSEWEKMGVRIEGNQSINPSLEASIIEPDGGPTWMTFNNFDVLMKWNRSIYYVGTVNYLGNQVCRG